ncbi:MAG: polysaccharide biosynthesis protein [Patescibacteria group bacterium]|nr:MAG: polysaccharide biosynthesis protein [Patescibacteria group bacterium]
MKSIFNSLGSNYSLKFVSTSLWSIFFSRKSDVKKLERHLAQTYGGEVLSLYKGRDAIEACCRVLLKPGSEIITQAFSCYAVEEGMLRAGMKAVYADISRDSTNLTVESIAETYKKYPQAKAVLIQHSLGIPADSVAIRKWCNTHGLLMIEDIAQGIGGIDSTGKMLGELADAVIFSFGKDKIIDAISGGAVVFKVMDDERNERLIDVKKMVGKLPFSIVYEDLLYPDLTSFIRKTHHFGFGKVVFVLAKKLGLLGSPIKSKTDTMTWMHQAYAKLAVLQFKGLEQQIEHRKKIAQIYFEQLSQSSLKQGGLQLLFTKEELERSSNLRFSVRCTDDTQVKKLVAALKKNRIYVSDRWYRWSVDCGSYQCKTMYQNKSCPHAELLATQVLNLPTHREITPAIAKKICTILLENV